MSYFKATWSNSFLNKTKLFMLMLYLESGNSNGVLVNVWQLALWGVNGWSVTSAEFNSANTSTMANSERPRRYHWSQCWKEISTAGSSKVVRVSFSIPKGPGMENWPFQGSDGEGQEGGNKSRDKVGINKKKENKESRKKHGKEETQTFNTIPSNSSISILQKGKLRTKEEK